MPVRGSVAVHHASTLTHVGHPSGAGSQASFRCYSSVSSAVCGSSRKERKKMYTWQRSHALPIRVAAPPFCRRRLTDASEGFASCGRSLACAEPAGGDCSSLRFLAISRTYGSCRLSHHHESYLAGRYNMLQRNAEAINNQALTAPGMRKP